MLVSVVTVLVGIVTTITAPQFESRIKKGENQKKNKKKVERKKKKKKKKKKKGGRSDLTSILTVARCAEPRHPVRLVAVVVVAAVPVAGGTKYCLES